MAVLSFLRNTYCRSIFVYGTDRFTPRDGCKGIREEYREPVKEYFAETYELSHLQAALESGWINQQEYEETAALFPEGNEEATPDQTSPPELKE
ncbi:hypothetical protein [Paenibacillus chitinolyticus]|uniref:XkdX family protein n=1 Tax=Paenibacillus chitinolyticus TaxID=79263 RepID=A0ABT4FRM5_9BACL|nr:hypothetical protein [Paenibacillus chitinolyticus]MCY9593715.1 hypothetical protein [Paenibacillus chitinolyticus]MCY9599719.1 hypothetical protein [Paenibacillus chitinolyticus]